MKKKVLAIVLVLALCVGIVSIASSAYNLNAWNMLQFAINESDGSTIDLVVSAVAEDGDSQLVIPKDKTVTIDLNGWTIDRGLSDGSAVEEGRVFLVEGNLTIIDSSMKMTGKITGGNSIGAGGAVYVKESGTFTLGGGTICNNKTQDGGGAVFACGTFIMTDGVITQNFAEKNAGGVYIYGSHFAEPVRMPKKAVTKTSVISGGEISYNTCNGNGGGIYVDYYDMDLSLDNCLIANNMTKGHGGGLSSNRSITIGQNTVFKNNFATLVITSDIFAPNQIKGNLLSESLERVINSVMTVFSAIMGY